MLHVRVHSRSQARQLLAKADVARRAGLNAEATALLEQVVALKSPDHAASAMTALSAIARKAGDLAEAVRQLSRARELLPDVGAIPVQLGQDLRQLGRHGEAVTAFDRALKCVHLAPGLRRRAVRGGALAAFAVGSPDAEQRLEQAVDEYAGDCEAWSCLAAHRAARGRVDEATAAFHRVLRFNRNDLEAHERLLALGGEPSRATVLAGLWRPEPSSGLDQQAIERLFDHLRIGEREEALALASSAGDPRAYRPNAGALVALVQQWTGDLAAAGRTLTALPPRPFPRFVQALVQLSRGEEDDARSGLDALCREGLPFPAIEFLSGTCHDVAGDLDGAAALYQRVLEEDPGDAEAMLLLAEVRRRQGRDELSRALQCKAYLAAPVLLAAAARFRLDAIAARRVRAARARAQAEVGRDPGDAEARLRLARACAEQGDFEAVLVAAGAPEGSTPTLHREAGYAHFAHGALSAAAASLRQALDADPDDGVAHMRLGEVLARMDERGDAERHLDLALRADPHAFYALAAKAILLSMRGAYRDAAEHYLAAMRADPTQREPHLNLAADLDESGDLAGAERELRFATALMPGDADVHLRHGDFLRRLGRAEASEAAQQHAIALQRASLSRQALGGHLPPPLEVEAPSPFVREIRIVLDELAAVVCGSPPASDRAERGPGGARPDPRS